MRLEQKLLTLIFFTALAWGTAWADDQSSDASTASTQPSHVEGWVESEDLDDTYFGMGFESRQLMSGNTGAAGASGTGGISGLKKGGSKKGN